MNGALWDSSTKRAHLQKLSIQKLTKLRVTGEWGNNAANRTKNSIRPKSVKKISLPKTNFDMSRSTAWVAPDVLKALVILSTTKFQKICSSTKIPGTLLEIRKRTILLKEINQPIVYKLLEDFKNIRKKVLEITIRLKLRKSLTITYIP